MTITQYLDTGVSALVAATAATLCVTYHRLAPWHSTPMVRHLMMLSGALGALGMYSVAIILVGPDGTPATVLRVLRAGLLLIVTALLIQRTVMVVRRQRKRPPRRRS